MSDMISGGKETKAENSRRALLSEILHNNRRNALIGTNINNALESLWANRLRSVLTLLGIMIGIGGFIAVVILTQGAGAQFNTFAQSTTARTLTVIPGSASQAGGQTRIQAGGSGSIKLTSDDLQALQKLPHVVDASPLVPGSGGNVSFAGHNWSTQMDGISAAHQLSYWPTSEGSWWSESDEQIGLPVAVIGQTVAANTFALAGVDPIGRAIRIDNQLYRVVGVLAKQGLSLTAGGLDDVIYVPYTTLLHSRANASIIQIAVEADTLSVIDLVKQEMTMTLRQRHQISSGISSGFIIQTSDQAVQSQQQTNSIIAVILMSIGSISLVVGGIGIMNIMLVSVTERTREIGLRSALGAEPGDIRNQFLIEALVLSLVGGAIGLLLGILAGYLLALEARFPFKLSPLSFLLAFVVAALVGTVFGFYPAVRASRLDPVVALRSE